MRDFVIITDSTTDLPHELAEKNELIVLPLTYHIEYADGKKEDYVNYLDYRQQDINEFYNIVKEGATVTTSQLNSEDYKKAATPHLEAGRDVLILAFSSKLSGTYNSARLATLDLVEEFSDRKIILIDTKSASLGEGMLVTLAAEKRKAGATIEEVAKYTEEMMPKIAHWFTVDDIAHLRRGGRISSTASFVARTLRIKPIMHTNNDGELIPRHKAVSRRRSIKALFDKMVETAVEPQQRVFIGHGDDLEAAETLKSYILEQYPDAEVLINTIGPVVGAHTGQGVLALFFIASER